MKKLRNIMFLISITIILFSSCSEYRYFYKEINKINSISGVYYHKVIKKDALYGKMHVNIDIEDEIIVDRVVIETPTGNDIINNNSDIPSASIVKLQQENNNLYKETSKNQNKISNLQAENSILQENNIDLQQQIDILKQENHIFKVQNENLIDQKDGAFCGQIENINRLSSELEIYKNRLQDVKMVFRAIYSTELNFDDDERKYFDADYKIDFENNEIVLPIYDDGNIDFKRDIFEKYKLDQRFICVKIEENDYFVVWKLKFKY